MASNRLLEELHISFVLPAGQRRFCGQNLAVARPIKDLSKETGKLFFPWIHVLY